MPRDYPHGADWYRKFGTPKSPGTKVYTILGNVNVTGVIEVPMGITLREVIAIYGKGMKNGATVQTGADRRLERLDDSGELQDTPMDFESFSKAGVSLGSGALLMCDEDTCVIDLAKVLMNFFKNESCGKCTPCRIGHVSRLSHCSTKISKGDGTQDDLTQLQLLADSLITLSNCGLGQTAAVPIRDILKHFRAEVDAHINLKVCPAGVCPMMVEEAELA